MNFDNIDWSSEQLYLTLPTFALAVFSLIGSIYVCISAYCLRKYKGRSGPFIITHCVFWMSACDIFINLWILVVWAPPLFSFVHRWSDFQCQIIGSFGQFFLVASVCWYSVIMYCLWILISSSNQRQNLNESLTTNDNLLLLQQQASLNAEVEYDDFSNTLYFSPNRSLIKKKYGKWKNKPNNLISHKRRTLSQRLQRCAKIGGILTVLFSIAMTGVPWIDDSYGYVINVNPNKSNKFECWITNDHPFYQLTLYIPILLYMLFAIIVIVLCILRFKRVNSYVKSDSDFRKTKKGLLIQRLVVFITIFWVTWTVPIIVRVWIHWPGNEYAPFILVALNHASIGFIGLGNSIVWITSTSFQGFTKSIKYRKMKGNPMNAKSAHALQEEADSRAGRFLTFSGNHDGKRKPSNKLTTPLETPTLSNLTSQPSMRILTDINISPNYKPFAAQSLNDKKLISFGISNKRNNYFNINNNNDDNNNSNNSTLFDNRNVDNDASTIYRMGYAGGLGGQGGGLGNTRTKRNAAKVRKNSRKYSDYNNNNNNNPVSKHSIEMTPSNTANKSLSGLQNDQKLQQFSIYDSGVTTRVNTSIVNTNDNGSNTIDNNDNKNNKNDKNNNSMVGYQPPQLGNTPNSNQSNTNNTNSGILLTFRGSGESNVLGNGATLTPPASFIQNSFSNTVTTQGTVEIHSSGTANTISAMYKKMQQQQKMQEEKEQEFHEKQLKLQQEQNEKKENRNEKNIGKNKNGTNNKSKNSVNVNDNKAKNTNSYHNDDNRNNHYNAKQARMNPQSMRQTDEIGSNIFDERGVFDDDDDDDDDSFSFTQQASLQSSQFLD